MLFSGQVDNGSDRTSSTDTIDKSARTKLTRSHIDLLTMIEVKKAVAQEG
jgi:hypothetical protein